MIMKSTKKTYEKKEIIKKAEEIAAYIHANQYRKGGYIPYIEHPQDVVNRLGDNWELIVVGWLHDVLEQSDKTKEFLIQQGIPKYLVDEIVLLTHKKDASYSDYIDLISSSKIATQVKIADILSNLSGQPSINQIKKYSKALLKLSKSQFEERGIELRENSIDELSEEIKDGLYSHQNDPISWLDSFIDDLHKENLNGIIADKDLVPEKLQKLKNPPRVLVVDCGTGETKLLLYQVHNNRIKLEEIAKLNSALAYIDKSEDFINTIRYHFSKNEVDIVLIAASAWLREASLDILHKGNSLLTQLIDSGMLCKILESREESWLELIAAEYVTQKLNLKINGTYASGAGSTQFTKHFGEVFPYRIGNEVGRRLIIRKGLAGAKEWEDEIRRIFSDRKLNLTGIILCISAVTYAAIESGLPLNTLLPYEEVIQKFKNYIKKQTEKSNLSSNDIRNLSNVIQHLYTIENQISSTSKLIFLRDVEILGEKLRITWSLGWYLELLSQLSYMHIQNKTLITFRREQIRLKQIGQEFRQDSGNVTVTKTATGQVLLDINQTADIILDKANQIEKLVTYQLQKNATKTGARLEGLQFRLKTRESLIRKLKSRLQKIITDNTAIQLYIPRLTDIFNEVDDILRYTVIIDTHNYTKITITFLESLKKELDCEYKCFSFWNRESTYLGINSFLTITGFTFEIQFHTQESWKIKQSESHDLYEAFRKLPYSYAKFLLYSNMKEIWNSVPIPPDIEKIEKPISMIDPLLEQYGVIRNLCRRITIPLNNTILNDFLSKNPLVNDLCLRLIRGKNEEEFKYLSYPLTSKRLAWVSNSENLLKLLESDSSHILKSISDLTGKPLSWVNSKFQMGYSWKLVILPKQHCVIANWEGVFRCIQEFFPRIASIIFRFKKQLVDSNFLEIELQIYPPNTFRNIKDNPINNMQYIDEDKLIELVCPLLWHVRGFLYNIIGLNENFKGDGFVYNDSLKKMQKEYLVQNRVINEIFGAQIIDLGPINETQK
jgi:hypothetical protein